MLSYNFAFDLRCQSQISFSWIETPLKFFFFPESKVVCTLKKKGGGHIETPKLVLQTFDFS